MTQLKNIAVITSGGDAQGMNTCLKVIVDIAQKKDINVVAFLSGYQGIIDDDFTMLTRANVKNISDFGGSAIYSGRSKDFMFEKNVIKAANVLKQHDISALIVLGGEGSAKGAFDFSKFTDVPIYVIPCTIDNDMGCTERSIGFDTAVNNATNAINTIQQTMQATKRISVIETMGRHHGDIALYSALASESEIAIIPEKPKTEEEIFNYITQQLKMGNIPTVVVSEKLFDINDLATKIQNKFNIETRAMVLGYLQRGGTPSVADKILATRMGVEAVLCAVNKKPNSVLCLLNKKIVAVDLKTACATEKTMDIELREMFKTLNNK